MPAWHGCSSPTVLRPNNLARPPGKSGVPDMSIVPRFAPECPSWRNVTPALWRSVEIRDLREANFPPIL